MNYRYLTGAGRIFFALLLLVAASACHTTKHLKPGQHLLRSYTLTLKSDQGITHKGEFKELLNTLVLQKPNSYTLGIFPIKLWLYNSRYKRYQKDTTDANSQVKSRTVERPVIYDSLSTRRSTRNLLNYLNNQGYFYATVADTTKFKHKKAYVTYRVNTGTQYLINKPVLDVDDSLIKGFVNAELDQTVFQRGTPYSQATVLAERSRIAGNLRNYGYYKFTPENISFKIDTAIHTSLHGNQSVFDNIISLFTFQKAFKKNPGLDITIVIRKGADSTAYQRYRISKVTVLPDFADRSDLRDTTMLVKVAGDDTFRYHNYYVKENVLASHIFLVPGEYYSQANYDQTINKLNELGIFQYTRIFLRENDSTQDDHTVSCYILLNPSKKFDFSTNFNVSNATTYTLGNAVSFGFTNRNLLRGANQLSLSLSGGIETAYTPSYGSNFIEHFYLLSKNAAANASITFPKFIAPFGLGNIKSYTLPNTILSVGVSLQDRVEYFTLVNTTANFTYNWRKSQTRTFDFSPIFVSVLQLPRITDDFKARLDTVQFLYNSYRENFIEGENLTYTFNNESSPIARYHSSYIRASIEEAGGLLSGLSELSNLASNKFGFNYSQYLKLDLDARHYFKFNRSVLATRFFAGIGLPYANSSTLPYVKQYFVGGAYSLRGWRIRSLGPGTYYNPADSNANYIDRTGDIKLEANVEYRFDIVQLFYGAMKLGGAVFTDAGNIWLARPDPNYPGGEFKFSTLGQAIAVSSGVGARLDIGGLFVLRFDAGIPVKKPYILQDGGWVIHEISLGDSKWRAENLVLNIAIGYPF